MKKTTRTPKNTKHQSTAHSQRLALESRMVFDGAIAATAVDVRADVIDKPATNTTSEATPPHVDFTVDKTAVAVDFQPSDQNLDNQPAFSVGSDPLNSPDLPLAPVAGVSGSYASVLLVVDPRADNASALLANLPANTQILTLDTARNGFQQVADIMQGRHDITQLNILPWVDGNNQWLGNNALTNSPDPATSTELMHWGDSLASDAHIVFHSPNTPGTSWLDYVDALTGANASWSSDTRLTAQPHELIVVDTHIANYQTLINEINPNAEVLFINAGQDGISQLANDLQGRTDISALHILSHGHQGELILGTTTLDSSNIDSYQSQLAEIGRSLTANGDILVYGCDVANGASGITFVNHLADLTNADVAASNNTTGNATKGGDWTLEYHAGTIESRNLAAVDYDGELAGNVVFGSATASVGAIEQQLGITTIKATGGIAQLSYSISGGADAAQFIIDSATGNLSFVTAHTIAAPTDAGLNNVYDVQITASDGFTSATQNLAVSVAVPDPNTAGFGVATGTQTFFIPGTSEQMWYLLKQMQSDNNPDLSLATYTSKGLHSVVTIAATADNTVVYYDQWEDGYDTAAGAPAGVATSSTVVINGQTVTKTTYAGSSTVAYTLNTGQSIQLETKNAPINHRTVSAYDPTGANIRNAAGETIYDGGDRLFVVGGPVTANYAMWPDAIGTVFAMAWEIYPAKPDNTAYTIPIGENMGVTSFQSVNVVVQATVDNTVVGFDTNGDGVFDTVIDTDLNGTPDAYQVTLNKGQSIQLTHVNLGTKVLSTNPTQVLMVTGSNADYESRAYSLTPSTLWSNDYYSPIDGGITVPTDLFLYNPNATAITVYYDEAGGSNNSVAGTPYVADGSFTIAAHSTIKYSALVGHTVPDNSAVHLFTANSANKFWGVGAVDSTAGMNWGFSLIPGYILNTDYTFGWAPQWDFNNQPANTASLQGGKGSGIFVTPANDNTTIFIDYNHDGVVDRTITLNRLQNYVIYDPTDNDLTGTHIWATDKIAAAWGENPDTSQLGLPYLDMGYTALPLPSSWLDVAYGVIKTSNIDILAPSGAPQTVTYTLQVPAYQVVLGLSVTDKLAAGWNYVDGSAVIIRPDGSSLTGAGANPILGTVAGRQTMLWNDHQIPSTIDTNSMVTIRYSAMTSVNVAPGASENDVVATATPASIGISMTATDNKFVDIGATIGDIIFNDLNNNNTLDAGETGIAGVVVELRRNSDNTLIATATTDSNGRFLFTGLDDSPTTSAGIFKLAVIDGAGSVLAAYSVSSGGSNTATNISLNDDTHAGRNFGYHTPTISGQARLDANNDGILQVGEPGLAGVSVSLYLDNNANGMLDSNDTLVASKVTDSNGAYSFSGVVIGNNYLVVEQNLTGYTSTFDTDGNAFANGLDTIAIKPLTGDSANNNFADYIAPPPPASITKAVISTSNAQTGIIDGNNNTLIDLANGETVTYELVVTVPDGRSPANLTISDLLPSTVNGTSLSYSSAVIKAIGSNILGSALAVGATPTSQSGQNITFDFGNNVSTHSTDGAITDADKIVIWVTAQAGMITSSTVTPTQLWTLDINQVSVATNSGIANAINGGQAAISKNYYINGQIAGHIGTGIAMYASSDNLGSATAAHAYIDTQATATTLGVDPTNAFTMNVWFNTSVTRSGVLFAEATGITGAQIETGIIINSSGQLQAGIGGNISTTSTASYNNGAWYMATLVKDTTGATHTTNDSHLYIYNESGVLQQKIDFTSGSTLLTGYNVTLGGVVSSNAAADYDGKLDNASIFTSALTQAQVAALAATPSPSHQWNMDNANSGTIAVAANIIDAVSLPAAAATVSQKAATGAAGYISTAGNAILMANGTGGANDDATTAETSNQSYISLAANTGTSTGLGVDVTNSYTQTVWFNTTTARGLILGEATSTTAMESGIFIDATGHLVANIGGTSVTSTNTNYTNGNWYMAALVKDTTGATHTANDSHLYIYNSAGTQVEVLNFQSGSTAQTATLTIGGNLSGIAALDFDGTVDDVRIYSSALTASQIADIAKNSLSITGASSTQSLLNTANVQSGTLIDGSSTANVEVLIATPTNRGSISGQVQIDGNNNGVMDDAATTRLGDFTVTLKDSGGTVITTRQTAYDGSYEFGGLTTGATYRIEITPPATYVGLDDFDHGTLNQIITATVTDNTFITGQNFLIAQPKPTLDLDTTAAGTGYTGNFVFGGSAVPISLQNAAADLGVDIAEDASVTQLSQLTVTLTNHPDGNAESLTVGSLPAGIVVLSPYDPATGTLVLTGAASLANYETALEAIRYNNTSAKTDLDPTARLLNVQVRDINGQSSNVAVTTLNIIDLAPVANPDSYAVAEDSGTTPLTVLSNDTTGDGASSIIAVTVPKDANGVVIGTAVINGTQINFTPNANYNGAASFQYTITDSNGDVSTTTVNMTVTPVDDIPFAVTDSATTPQGLPVNINVLSNDSSADGWATPNAVVNATKGANGTVTINVDGTVTYSPAPAFSGNDSFTYTVRDSNGDEVSTTVNVTVTANLNPLAANDSATTPAGRSININVLGNDNQGDGPAQVTAVTPSAHGITPTINPDGTIQYVSNGLFAGNDTFTYTITDKNGTTSTAQVTVTIANSAPQANADVYVLNAVTMGETLTIPATSSGLIGNDFDADGTAGLVIKNYTNGASTVLPGTVLTTTQGGTVTVNADGTLSYTRPAGFKGADSFNYTLTDPTGATSIAPVTIIVIENHNPVARDDSYSVGKNNTLTTNASTGVIQKVTADSDIDVGDILTVIGYNENTTHGGIVSMLPDGSFTYTPTNNFIGTDTFQYEISDGHGGTSIATVSIDVTPSIPVAGNDTTIVQNTLGSSVTFSIVANDSDAGGGVIVSTTITSLPPVAQGTLYMPDGSTPITLNQVLTAAQAANLVFKPSGTFTGDSTFTYTALDDDGSTSNVATVTIQVVSGPVVLANDDTASTLQDHSVQITLTNNDIGSPNALDLNSIVITAPPPDPDGMVIVDGNGKVTFIPAPGFHGTTSFRYTISDNNPVDAGGPNISNEATVTVTVNGDVIAVDDNYPSVPKNSHQYILPVLNNDSDPEGDFFSIISVSSPGHGVVEINNASNAVLYTPTTGYEGTDTFTYTILDSHGNTKTATVDLTVVAHGNAPTIDLDKTDRTTTGADYVTEFAVGGVGASGTIGVPVSAADTLTAVTDDDSALMSGAVIKLTNMQNTGNEILSIANVPGIAATYNALTGELTLTGTATKQFYEIALSSLTYNNTSATPETNIVRDISVQLMDTDGNTSNVAHSFISLYAPPHVDLDGSVAGTGYTGTFVAGVDTSIAISNSGIVSDVDDQGRLPGHTKTMIVTLTNRPDGTNESLTVDSAALAALGLTSTYNVAAGELILTSTDSNVLRLPSAYQDALATIHYQNSTLSATINMSDRVLTVVAIDGQNLFSNTATATIHIDVTKPAVSTNLVSTPFIEAKDVPSTPVVIDNTLTVIERVHSTLPSATVSITGNYVSGEDILAFTNDGSTMGNITASYSNGILSLVSAGNTATTAEWQAALRSVTYLNSSDTPNANDRTISFQVSDGTYSSDIATKTVTVTPTNDTPSYQLLAAGTTINYTEKGSAVVFSNVVGIFDPELSPLAGGTGNFNGSTLTVSRNLGANSQDIFSSTSTGTLSPLSEGGNLVLAGTTVGTVTQNSAGTLILTFSNNATQAQVNSVLQQLAYSNSSSAPPSSVDVVGVFNDGNTTANEQGRGGALFTTGIITVNITPVNDTPVANDDTGNTDEDVPLTVTATNGLITSALAAGGVDTDIDSVALTITGFTIDKDGSGTQAAIAVATPTTLTTAGGTAIGTLTINADGSYVFVPALNYNGAVPVATYTLSDGSLTDTATLTITINPINDTPAAKDNSYSTQQNTTLTGSNMITNTDAIAGLDSDPDSDPLTVTLINGMAYSVGTPIPLLHGSLTVTSNNGAFTYTPTTGDSTGDSFTYTVSDGNGGTAQATVNIDVNGTPIANPDTNAVNENTPLTVATADGVILSGTVSAGVDTDPDNDPITVIGVIPGTAANTAAVGIANVASSLLGTYGHLTLASDGSYVYTADTAAADALGQGVTANDVFSYAISDGNGGIAFTTLTITVTGTNDAPTAVGSLPPVTQADSTAVNVPTVAGFTDLDSNNVFTYTASGLPTGLTINPATGAITGTLANNASQGGTAGVYSIVVTATDSQGIPVSQTFSFTATNPAPTANPDVNAVAENATLTVTAANGVILSGTVPAGVDTDPDNDPLTVIGVTTGTAANTAAVGTANVASSLLGTYGHLTLASDGSYVYTADTAAADALGQGITATDVFSYAISDGNGGTAFTTLTITVTGTNDNPVAIDDTNVTDKNVILTVPVATGVLSNDTDVDTGDTLTVGAVNGVAGNIGANVTGSNGGTFNIANDGSYTFDPGTDFNSLAPGATATTNVTYTAADNHGGTATATLTITVRGLNRNPVANADTGSLLENGVINASVTNGAIQSTSVPAGKDTDPDGDTLSIIGVTTGTAPDVVSVGTANLGTALIGTYGTLTLNSDGSYSYTADHADALPAGVQATDTFSYAISDGRNGTSFTTLTFTITGVNDAPITIGNLAGVTQTDGTPVNIPTSTHFSDADGSLVYSATGLPSGLTINPVTGAIAGTLSNSASQGGTGGVYSITVTATDAEGAKVSQNFTFTALNSVPTAHNDTGSVTENASITVNASSGVISGAVPVAKDTDPNGDVLTVIGVRTGVATSVPDVGTANIGSIVVGKYGILALNANGSYSYSADRADTLDAGVIANDIFSYAISDGKGGTAFATLTIAVTGTNDAPAPLGILPDVSKIDSSVVKIGTAANFTDLDSHNVFRYSAAGLPAGLSINPATGLITGTLTANASQGGIAGIYTITVTATDSQGMLAVQHFNFTALPVANNVSVVPNTEVTPGSLILLNNPDKPGTPADYHELEKKDCHIDYKPKDDGNLPPAHLSLYVPIRHHVISLTGELRDQVVLKLERYSFSVPRWMFRHTDPNEQLEFEAMRPDGSPLPEWLKFDPKTLRFYGLVPKCAHNEIVMVVARDTYGNEVHPTFTVHVNRERVRPGQKPEAKINGSCGKSAVGKSALSEQVQAAGKLSKLQESRALIHSLKQL